VARVLLTSYNLKPRSELNHFKGNKDSLVEQLARCISGGISFYTDSCHGHLELAVLSKLDSMWGYSFVLIIACLLELLKTCTYTYSQTSMK